ncbi:hypothetical protein GCM10010960_07270 [Arenimonas maotaiensis]|uniref:PepSY domain-containing protein n=1 Tax=Arenimonas maotaiensis TaxID=1446479 RepID=A0A917CGK6_9GAMM|nr:hypothetical protein [Arenimonas maotaiensis]GGF87905.1 hypothetical protein GCM10010960_07270 [Arenimonas maotaiensis]
MKIRLIILLSFGAGLYAAGTGATPTRPAAARQAQPAAQTQAPPVRNAPNAKTSFGSSSSRRPVTLGQVERQTGGKVIGAVPVTVEGRQLNQIKVRMPNGRIVIDRRLFDGNGRSVDTVNVDDAGSDPRR